MVLKPQSLILSNTNGISDAIFIFPLAGILKQTYPSLKIYFLGTKYIQAIVASCGFIDEFIDWNELRDLPLKTRAEKLKFYEVDTIVHIFPDEEILKTAKKSKIQNRIANTGLFDSWKYVNRRARFSRKKSNLHDAQLNFKLLKPLGIQKTPDLTEIPQYYGIRNIFKLPEWIQEKIDKSKFRLIIHPKSGTEAKEWRLEHFTRLIEVLPKDKFQIFVTGTLEDKRRIESWRILSQKNVVNTLGKLNLSELIALVNETNGVLASSTGTLHIAATLDKHSIGLYSPKKPFHPERRAPICQKAKVFVHDENCQNCAKGLGCNCINLISYQEIADYISTLV